MEDYYKKSVNPSILLLNSFQVFSWFFFCILKCISWASNVDFKQASFKADTLRSSWNDTLRSLLSFSTDEELDQLKLNAYQDNATYVKEVQPKRRPARSNPLVILIGTSTTRDIDPMSLSVKYTVQEYEVIKEPNLYYRGCSQRTLMFHSMLSALYLLNWRIDWLVSLCMINLLSRRNCHCCIEYSGNPRCYNFSFCIEWCENQN
jgi:hypothetical protein